MFSHITRTAFRNALQFKLHSLISLVSLVFGFTCFIAASVTTNYLDSFDRHLPDADKIYVLVQGTISDGQIGLGPVTHKPAADYLRLEFPELALVTKATMVWPTDVTIDGRTDSMGIRFVDAGFFDIFPMTMLKGVAPRNHLASDTAIITEQAALTKFGTTDVVGERLLLAHHFEVTIVGVSKSFDHPSHIGSAIPVLSTDLFASIETYNRINEARTRALYADDSVDQWGDQSYYTYLKFPPGRDVDESLFNERLELFVEKYVPPDRAQNLKLTIQPINKLIPTILYALSSGVDMGTVLFLAGVMVLLIGCLNYTNLVVAQLSLRTQEIGVQKILGARRSMLVFQYAYESALFVLFCLAVALCLIWLGLNAFENMSAVGVDGTLLLSSSLWLNICCVVVMIVGVSGVYPALRTLKVSLVTLLRPKGSGGYSGMLRSSMVGMQFVISCVLIVLSFVMFSQNREMLNRVNDDSAEQKVTITVPINILPVNAEILAAELTRHPDILSTTLVQDLPWAMGMQTISLARMPDLDTPKIESINRTIGYDFNETLGLSIIAGRPFARDRVNDLFPAMTAVTSAKGPFAIILDEEAVKKLGWVRPEDAIGQMIYRRYLPPKVATPIVVEQVIIGTTGSENFGFLNYGAFGLSGYAYTLQPDNAHYMVVRLSRNNVEASLRHIDAVWKTLLPEVPLKRKFMDELFYSVYSMLVTVNAAIGGISILAFLIASVGLLGNATFVTNIRQKEIGIRKVMGASSSTLLRMLLFDFAKPVLIANVIAFPLAYVLAKGYLSFFSVQASLTMLPFLLSIGISVLIACLSVVFQSIKSARVRPATILRYE